MNGLFPSLHEWKQGVRYAIVLLTLALVIWRIDAVVLGLLPFVIAFGISLALDPIVTRLATRLRLGRGWSSLIVLLFFVLIGWWIGSWGMAAVITAVAHFLDVFPEYRATVVQYVQEWTNHVSRAYAALPPNITQLIAENTSHLAETIEQILSSMGRAFLNLLRTLPGLLTAGLLIPLATFFISKDLPRIKELLWSLVPSDDHSRVIRIVGDLWGSAWHYVRAQAILMSLTTIVATTGLFIIGVDNWFAAGVFIGVLDFLPILGPTVAFLPWALYLVIAGNTTLALSLMAVYGAAVGMRALVEPKVVGDSIGLHPLAILLSMYMGALMLGLKGAVIGPIVLLIGKVFYKAWQIVEPAKNQPR